MAAEPTTPTAAAARTRRELRCGVMSRLEPQTTKGVNGARVERPNRAPSSTARPLSAVGLDLCEAAVAVGAAHHPVESVAADEEVGSLLAEQLVISQAAKNKVAPGVAGKPEEDSVSLEDVFITLTGSEAA